MAAFCINTHLQEFKDTAKRLGVSQFELEQIAYKYGNQEGTFGQFPSDDYIKEQLSGAPDYDATEAQAELWKMRYSTPREFDTLEELNAAKKDALQYFSDKSVRGFVNTNGKYELRVAEQKMGSAEEVLLQKNSQNRQRNLEILRTFYAGVVSGVVKERRALAEQKRTEYNNRLFKRESIDVTGKFQQREAQSALESFRKRYGSIADSYLFTLPNGDIKLVVKPLSEETLQNRALSVLSRMSDSDLASEVQRLSQEYEVDDDMLYYINPKKVEEIKAQIAKKNRVFNEETINESIQFLEELENTQENNLFVQTAIKWLKNGTVIFPRDAEKVKQIFESARKYGIDVQSSKSPIELQLKILEKNVKEITAGKPIDPSLYKELSYNRTVTTEDGKQVVIYDVEDSESGQRAVCNILAAASPKVNGEPASSPWCLSTFNYNKDTQSATPTASAAHFWEHYNKGKRQIAFVDNRPVAFNSSSENRAESWWDFNDTRAFDNITNIDFESPAKLYEKNAQKEEYNTFVSGIYTVDTKGGEVFNTKASPSEDLEIESGQNFRGESFLNFHINEVGSVYVNTRTLPTPGSPMQITDIQFSHSGVRIRKNVEAWFNIKYGGYEVITDLWGPEFTKIDREDIRRKLNEVYENLGSFLNAEEAKARDFFKNKNKFDINNLQHIADAQSLAEELREMRKAGERSFIDAANKIIDKAINDAKSKQSPQQGNTTVRKSNVALEIESLAEEEILTDSWAPVQNEYTPREGFQGDEYANEDDAEYASVYGEEELDKLEKSTGIRYKMRELLQALNFGREKSYANAYNERVLKPLNKQLANKLYPLLREWNFSVIEGSLKEVFGDDVLGALDVLQKIVYLSDGGDRNQITDAEEFSHAFIKLMGATYRKANNRRAHPENKLYSELRDIIETTDIFRQTFEQYSTLKEYQYENGTPNRAKIAEEALGKALAVALNERYEARDEAEKSFLNKVVQWFKDALLWFKSFVNKNGRLERELNNIADSILRADGSYYGKYLQEAPENQQLVTWESTVERDAQEGGHGMELIRFINSVGGILTGSMSYRAQGTVYRTEQDSLHDLDFAFDASHTLYGRNPELRNPIGVRNLDNAEIVRMVQDDNVVQQIMQHDNMHFLQAFPATKFNGKNQIIVTFMRTENPELAERFRALSGSYAKRLSNFTDEERSQIHLIDCFFEQDSIESTQREGLNIANYRESFKAKLKMGRAKDLIDYRQWKPAVRRSKVSGDIMFQKNTVTGAKEITKEDIKVAKDLKRNKIEHLEGQISWLEDRVKYNRANAEQTAELEKIRRELAEEQSLYSGLENGTSEVYINEYNVPQIRRIINQPTLQSSFVQNAEFYSGAAQGSDSAWASEARKLGIKVTDYETKDYAALSQQEKDRVEQEYIEARGFLGKPVLSRNTNGGLLTRRDMMQADSADAIFAIGKITPVGGTEYSNGRPYINRSGHENVSGGTANAVARGIIRGIPVYVYDRDAKQWKTWDANTRSFIATEEPILTPHAAVIGTRGEFYADRKQYDITDEEKGVIRSILQKAINQPQQQSQQTLGQQVTTTPETTSQEKPLWAPPKVERAFREGQETIVTKMDNLLKSGTLTVTEVMDEANKAMDWISDQLTQYLEDPLIVWDKLGDEDSRKAGKTEEEFVAQVSKMSRKELVDFLGVDNLISFYTNDVLSLVETDETAGIIGNEDIFENFEDEDYERLDLLKDNIQGLIQYGYTRFLAREGFGFQLSDVEGEGFTTTEEISPEDRINVDNFNATDNIDGDEDVRNQQEHWMIENATRDIMDNASVKVKQAIADCYLLEDNGKTKADGTPDYDIAKDKLNRNERVVPIQAVRSIVKWIQGATKLSQMVERLEAQVPANPWVSQLVTRLKDTSGEESDFQSQFFNTFEKHFQAYSIVKMNPDGSYYTMTVNVNPALTDALDNMAVTRKVGGWSLVNENGLINLSALENFKGYGDTLENLGPLDEDTREGAIDMVGKILFTLGLPQTPEVVDRLLTEGFKNDIVLGVKNIVEKLTEVSKNNIKDYNPFEYGGKYGIRGFITTIIKPFTNLLEETMVSSVFDSGKMYQSYLTPSWTTKLFQKMHLPDREFKEFILDEFGSSEWFIEPNTNLLADLDEKSLEGLTEQERDAAILQAKIDYISDPKHSNIWRTPWLAALMRMAPKEREEAFQHKVQLNFNKQNYMRGMDDLTYVMSVFTEYFSVSAKGAGGNMFAYYRFPMLSNKPSNEFVKFIRYANIGTPEVRGADANAILRGYISIFRQELSRIQTVEMRNLKEGDEGYTANFDANGGKGSGLRFNFLDYLNEYLTGEKETTALGQLLNRKLHATQSTVLPDGTSKFYASPATTEYAGNTLFALTAEENSQLEELVKEEIAKHLDGLANRLIEKYKANGLFEALKSIEGVGKTDFDVEGAIREFAWNDNFAQANLLQILVTDKAFYKNEEDLQKRLAQVHSPGIRGNWEALDFGERDEKGNVIRPPQRVSDGKLRVLKLKDYKEVRESIIENLKAVFDKKIEEAPESEKQAYEDLRDSIIAAYEDINVVDGQAFVSPTAYRKKAIAFGEWSKEDEKVYKNLMDGRFNMADIKRVFNPRKPFTYGKTTKQVNASLGTPIKSLRYGVQYKDSEYLLIMADAMLRGQETGRPNLLGAIFDVMENSYKTNSAEGIDFVVFDSGVKTGLSGAISINEFIDVEDGQRLATEKIQSLIYQGGKLGGVYNENYIDVLDAEDYTTQQSVPEHFMHGSLQWGSQIRALMPSDLETSYDGQPVMYEYTDPATGETIQKSAEEIRKDWEENTKKMVDQSVEELRKELGLVDGMSVADSNVLISKILQREILSNPRYGVDLLLACSVDAEGNFRIPLGDPIQSKRVEQLLNSIIKNRINKQKVAGGTLVEVTNFGTSKRLNIRFKDKSDATGKTLLKTRAEYLAEGHTQREFEDYVKENQGGIAYYECYAPAWTRDLFLKFADYKGNIDVEAIEMLDPDLLKMYGYRIPTEDKYSTAPYKIVGFLPQEAGDGFMQPWETTVIDGSDFDVDKKNLMRMALELQSKIKSKREFFKDNGYTEENEKFEKDYAKYRGSIIGPRAILEKIGNTGNISISEQERKEIEWYEKSRYKRDRVALKEERATRNEQAEETFDRRYKEQGLDKLDAAINELESREDLTAADEKKLEEYKKDYDKKYDKLTKSLDTIRANNERWYKEAVEERRQRLGSGVEKAIEVAKTQKRTAIVKRILQEGIFRNSSQIPASQRDIFKAVKQAYIDLAFKVERPEVGTKDYYNNLMFNMQWAIATHASTADKMLNPGNFDPQKRTGYMVEANRLGYSWDRLQGMSIDELKKLVFTSKNLMDFDVQTQFYKQNSVAGQVLGIFAVAKSAHAMFESRNYGILIERPFYIDGMAFSGAMHYDQKYDRKGNLIGKTLGSLVGASADAVKDPVLNLMNINKETINVLNTALRLGLDFETTALLLSSRAVSDVIDTYRKNSLVMKTSFEKEIKAVLRELEKSKYIGKDSTLQRQDLTREEMVWSIRGLEAEEPTEEEIKKANIIKYKVLNAVLGLSNASKTAQPLSDLSRLNSITSAPGPLYINTIVSDRKFGPAMSMDGIVKFSTGENGVENHVPVVREMVFDELKSLGAFYQSYDVAKQLFKRLKFTTATDRFEQLLGAIHPEMQFSIYSNEALLKSLADFFQSFLLVQSGVIKSSTLKRYTIEFVADYMAGKYTKDEKIANNPLIKAIQPKLISKKGQPDRYALNIDTTGMEQPEKDALSAGWTQLEKDDPTLSHMLFAYNFFRGGIGFSPKTFMGLVPIQVKEGIAGYNETFEHLPEIGNYHSIFDQWVRNNWTNTELVTKITTKPCDENTNTITFKGYKETSLVYNSPYIRVSTKNGDFLFVRTNISKTEATFAKIEPLGGNREYLEIYPTDTPVTAADNLQRGLATFETQESEIVERKEDNPDVEQTPEEQTRDLTDFYQVAFAEETSTEETREVTDSQFEEANKDLDIQTNKDKFDDIMDNFC